MPQFFVTSLPDGQGRLVIQGTDFHHLARVRRARAGEVLSLRTADGALLAARIASIGPDHLVAEIIDKKEARPIPLNLTLCAALLKGKKFDTVIRKAVEIGVARIIPVESERTVPEVGTRADERRARWQRIADEAAKQCLRHGLVGVERLHSFDEALGCCGDGVRMIAHPDERAPGIREFRGEHGDATHAAVLVGPEGGFSAGEIDRARAAGWSMVSFGFTQMRAETAAMVLPALLIYEWSS